jgi:hypothetical protein
VSRALAKDIWVHTADTHAGTFIIRLDSATNPQAFGAVNNLLLHLNETVMTYPGTTLRLRYALVSAPMPVAPEP